MVHTSSGVSAFVLTFWLGKSKVDNRPHNVPYVLLGAAMLWFGESTSWSRAWGAVSLQSQRAGGKNSDTDR